MKGVKGRVVDAAVDGLPICGSGKAIKDAVDGDWLWDTAWRIWLELKHGEEK